jgi:hypothetical protein
VLNADWNEDAFGHTEAGEKLGFGTDTRALLEGSWRHTEDADYFFVLNMSSVTDQLTFGVDGAEGTAGIVGEGRTVSTFSDAQGVDFISDAFGPWEMHVYRFDKPAAGLLSAHAAAAPRTVAPAVPEPAGFVALAAAGVVVLRRTRRGD